MGTWTGGRNKKSLPAYDKKHGVMHRKAKNGGDSVAWRENDRAHQGSRSQGKEQDETQHVDAPKGGSVQGGSKRRRGERGPRKGNSAVEMRGRVKKPNE